MYVISEDRKGRDEGNNIWLEDWDEAGREILFPTGDTYFHGSSNECTDSQLLHIRFFIIEHAVHYKFCESR